MSKEKIRHEEHRDLLENGYVEIERGLFCKYWTIPMDGGFEIYIQYYNFTKYSDSTAEEMCYSYAKKRVLMGYHLA